MAVMTTQQPEGVSFEQKIQPVPSSDKMALDLDINGTTNGDETTRNHFDAAPEDTLTKPVAPISPPQEMEPDATTTAVNGVSNAEAFSDNQTVIAPSIVTPLLPIESQPTEDESSSQLPDTNTTTAEEQQISAMDDGPVSAAPALFSPVASAVELAVEDVAAPSTVPPVVEAPESDIRNATPPPAPIADLPEEDLKMDFELDTSADLIQGEGIADRTAVPDLSDLGLSGSFDDTPALSVNDQAIQQDASDSTAPPFEPTTSAILDHDDTNMDDLGADSAIPEAAQLDSAPDNSMLPPKIAREREDDDENEPSAKRTKTEEGGGLDQEMADVPPAPAPAPNGNSAAATTDGTGISDYQTKQMAKILKNVNRTKDGRQFASPVAKLWPVIAEAYLQKISNPMDLGTMEIKLANSEYPNVEAFKDDARLIVANCIAFNGVDHLVTISARNVQDSLFTKLSNIPAEPAPVLKKDKKVKKEVTTDSPRTAAPRRPSRGSSTTTAPALATSSSQTFALDPATSMPLIRRDSNKGDGGRPKREIHPPKNKDLPYTFAKPKSRKFATELKFCQEVLKELDDSSHREFMHAFQIPVDPVALGIPNYFAVIKKPMDLQTIANKFKESQYGNAQDFEKDIRLIISNCYKFNPPGNPVRVMGERFEQLFNSEWSHKQQWVAEHSPSQSRAGTADSEDEESEEDEEEEMVSVGTGGISSAAKRLIEEQSKLIEMMKKKTDKGDIEVQQSVIGIIEAQVKKEGQAAPRPMTKKVKKPKAPKSKKAVPVRRAPAPKKKGSQNRYMGTLEKEVISAGIGQLPEELSSSVLDMIKAEQPGVDVADDGTLELDIDVVSVPTLWRIYGLIQENCPEVEVETRRQFEQREPARELAKPPSKKKNKPMSKTEQERRIEELKKKQEEFKRAGSGSQEPVLPTVEQAQDPDSSGDEDSDSEEE